MATARLSRQDCAELDRRDPLAAVRERFEPPPAGTVFLDGNSIGPMPRAAADCMLRALREEWSALRRRAWAAADWLDAPQRIGAGYAGLIGARPQDVIACDNTTLNLHKLLVYGLGLAAHDPRRNVIVSEREGFPTDCHVIQGVVHHSRGRWHSRTIESHDELDAALGDDVAMVLLAHVDYRSSLRWDMTAGNRKAHAVGARVLWDLSHSAGAVPVDLTAADADFAVACSYKYLCAGPGAPALAWIRPELQDRGWPALPGWLGHADRMHFASDYAPGPGVMQLITGTMPVLQNKAMEAAAEIWSGIPPADLAWKHRSLSATLVALIEEQCGALGAQVVSPRDYDRQGGHVAVRCPGGGPVCEALLAERVVSSFRKPDILRFGLSAVGLSHVDLWEAVARLRTILAEERWRDPRFAVVSV